MRMIPTINLTLVEEVHLYRMYQAVKHARRYYTPKLNIIMEIVRRNLSVSPIIVFQKYGISPSTWNDYKLMYGRFYE